MTRNPEKIRLRSRNFILFFFRVTFQSRKNFLCSTPNYVRMYVHAMERPTSRCHRLSVYLSFSEELSSYGVGFVDKLRPLHSQKKRQKSDFRDFCFFFSFFSLSLSLSASVGPSVRQPAHSRLPQHKCRLCRRRRRKRESSFVLRPHVVGTPTDRPTKH